MSSLTNRLLVFLLAIGISAMFAQGVDDQLGKLAGSAGKAYISPLVTNIGVNLNSGWLNKAPEAKRIGFDLEFGFVGMLSQAPTDQGDFTLSSTFRFSKSQAEDLTKSVTDADIRNQVIQQITSTDMPVTIYGPTIAGSSKRTIKVLFGPNGGQKFDINSAFPVTVVLPSQEVDLGVSGKIGGWKQIPLAAPQLKLGTLFGTRAILRFLPSVSMGDSIGDFSYIGFGLEHNVTYWLGDILPVDITAGFLTQNSKLGKSITFKATSYGLNVSKNFGWGPLKITPYAGYLMESSSMSVNFDQTIQTYGGGTQTSNIAFDVDGGGKSRVNVGAYLKIWILGLNAEYAMAEQKTFSASLLLNF